MNTKKIKIIIKAKIIKHELIAKNFIQKIDKYINQINKNEFDCFILKLSNSLLKTKKINNKEILLSFNFVKRLLQIINICNIFIKFRLN